MDDELLPEPEVGATTCRGRGIERAYRQTGENDAASSGTGAGPGSGDGIAGILIRWGTLAKSIWSNSPPTINTDKEIFMTKPGKDQQKKTSPAHPSHAEEAVKQKQKAEQSEVAGRHKNDGQKDHKGAR